MNLKMVVPLRVLWITAALLLAANTIATPPEDPPVPVPIPAKHPSFNCSLLLGLPYLSGGSVYTSIKGSCTLTLEGYEVINWSTRLVLFLWKGRVKEIVGFASYDSNDSPRVRDVFVDTC